MKYGLHACGQWVRGEENITMLKRFNHLFRSNVKSQFSHPGDRYQSQSQIFSSLILKISNVGIFSNIKVSAFKVLLIKSHWLMSISRCKCFILTELSRMDSHFLINLWAIIETTQSSPFEAFSQVFNSHFHVNENIFHKLQN